MFESDFVRVKGVDGVREVDLPLDFDKTLSFELLVSQFPYATGLKCINRNKRNVRTVRKSNGKFFLSHNEKWTQFSFYCTCSPHKKRIMLETELTGIKPKQKETIKSIHSKFPITFDILAIGLSFDTSEEDLYKYLCRFGELLYCKLKLDDVTLQSKGTAYFRFKEARDQNKCLNATHLVDKTKIIIKIPKEKVIVKENHNFKLYLFNISPNITREDLRTYFSQFGLVVNIFKPCDQRNFAFITFNDQQSIDRVLALGHHHTFNGGRVSVNLVVPKEDLLKGVKPSLINTQINNKSLKRPNNGNNANHVTKHMKSNHIEETQNICDSYSIKRQEPSQNSPAHHINNHHNLPSNYQLNIKIPQEYNALYPPPNYVTSSYFYNQMLPTSLHGDCLNTLIQSTSSIPFCNSNFYPHDQMTPFNNYQQSKQHPQMVSVLPNKDVEEDQSQLQSLVNMFIQEIRNNFDKLSKP